MNLKNLAYSAFFAAAIFVATAFVHVPLPVSGYIHLGDTFIFLACVFLPLKSASEDVEKHGALVFPMAASGLGSAMADLISGYAAYVPVTFAVKFVMAAIFKVFFGRKKWLDVLGAAVASVVMALGYFAYEVFVYGWAAAASIPFNILQGAVCAAIALPVAYSLKSFRNRRSQ